MGRLNIPEDWLTDSSRWSRRDQTVGIGGTVVYFIVACRYTFTHLEGRIEEFDGLTRIAPVADWNRRLPSVLGWDILRNFRLTADLRTRELFLE